MRLNRPCLSGDGFRKRMYFRYQDALRTCPPPSGGRTRSWTMSVANLAALSEIPMERAQEERLAAKREK